ncbi:MAG: hypothetical protein GBAus27B_000047 [Mycoplasmataceae bacterium]|nr:MAG: hypothetical protein GBAus27B_000047 [Mycoplasmataceae bacterium]
MSKKRTYQIKWTNQALKQLYQLVSESEAEKIQ